MEVASSRTPPTDEEIANAICRWADTHSYPDNPYTANGNNRTPRMIAAEIKNRSSVGSRIIGRVRQSGISLFLPK